MFTENDAKKVAELLNVDFMNFSIEDLLFGMNEELEHGTNYVDTNITNDNPIITAKIALAHLNVYPNYYNKEYGLPNLEKILREKLAEEEKLKENDVLDDIENKEC